MAEGAFKTSGREIQDNQTKNPDGVLLIYFKSRTHLRHSIGSLGSCWASKVRNDVNKVWSPAPVTRGTRLYSISSPLFYFT